MKQEEIWDDHNHNELVLQRSTKRMGNGEAIYCLVAYLGLCLPCTTESSLADSKTSCFANIILMA